MPATAQPSAPMGEGASKLVAGAPFVEALVLPQQRPDNASGAHFPLVLGCAASEATPLSAVCDWLETHKAHVESALVEHGGLVLRGFPVHDAQAFDALMVRLRCACVEAGAHTRECPLPARQSTRLLSY